MKRTRLTIFLLIIASIVSAVITLCMGAVQIPVQDTLSVLLQHLFGTDTGTPVSIAFEQIVWQIRMPRINLGFLAGSGLALCGCVTLTSLARRQVLRGEPLVRSFWGWA